MLVNLLSRKSFFSQIILIGLFLALFSLKLYPLILDWESGLGILFFLLAILVSVLFFNNSNLINTPGFAIFFFLGWVLVFSEISSNYRISISLFASTLVFWRLLVAERRPENKKFLFDIGFLLSLSAFFYPPSILLVAFLLFTFMYKQTVTVKGFILFFIGLGLPWLLGTQILFLIERTDWLIAYQDTFELNYWKTSIIGLIPMGLLILTCWFDHLSSLSIQDVNKRHYYFLAFLYFVNWVLIFAFFGGGNLGLVGFLALPTAIFLTRLAQYQKNEKFKEGLLWLFLVLMTGFYFRDEIVVVYQDLFGNVTL